jgi:hypothetical protein
VPDIFTMRGFVVLCCLMSELCFGGFKYGSTAMCRVLTVTWIIWGGSRAQFLTLLLLRLSVARWRKPST